MPHAVQACYGDLMTRDNDKGGPMVATRRNDLSVESVNDEMLVFNPARGEATALNPSAALVFEMCDGSNSIESMKTALEATGLGPSSDDAVWLALDELDEAGLIDLHVERPARMRGRRELLKQFGVGAAALAALPVVETIKAPSIADQGSPIAPTTTTTTTTTRGNAGADRGADPVADRADPVADRADLCADPGADLCADPVADCADLCADPGADLDAGLDDHRPGRPSCEHAGRDRANRSDAAHDRWGTDRVRDLGGLTGSARGAPRVRSPARER